MASRKRMIGTSVAIVATLVIGVPSLSRAQARGAAPAAGAQAPAEGRGGRRRGAPPFTPAAGAKDLKAAVFNGGWYIGMLRSNEKNDVPIRLEYKGKATMQQHG